MSCVHELKTLAPYWDAVERGEKTFEVRRDDRGFQKGDVLKLYRMDEHNNIAWKTGRMIERQVSYVLTGGQYGIEPGFVVMGLSSTLTHTKGKDND
ncbi:DUF3850 domain-containing protein [Microvirga sp. Mcv34]|uniref:DUF3850 domain-containing protein n=1 Tax=Microvirga sp. Mcv34 TaxID=2926016 RepID=UPI0021C82586|nr:DUF3850 domain-containing protein [Microvirga sp. Mcv34]